MGYDVQLVAKTRDKKLQDAIFDCMQEEEFNGLSRDFAMFQSRNFEGCELEQLQEIINLDLSILQKYPMNYELDTGEFEYRLYLAKEKNQLEQMEKLRKQIVNAKDDWERSYELDNEGWTNTNELMSFLKYFVEQLYLFDNLSTRIQPPVGWEYDWGEYFNTNKNSDVTGDRLVDDLKKLIVEIKCVEKYGVHYVGIIGG